MSIEDNNILKVAYFLESNKEGVFKSNYHLYDEDALNKARLMNLSSNNISIRKDRFDTILNTVSKADITYIQNMFNVISNGESILEFILHNTEGLPKIDCISEVKLNYNNSINKKNITKIINAAYSDETTHNANELAKIFYAEVIKELDNNEVEKLNSIIKIKITKVLINMLYNIFIIDDSNKIELTDIISRSAFKELYNAISKFEVKKESDWIKYLYITTEYQRCNSDKEKRRLINKRVINAVKIQECTMNEEKINLSKALVYKRSTGQLRTLSGITNSIREAIKDRFDRLVIIDGFIFHHRALANIKKNDKITINPKLTDEKLCSIKELKDNKDIKLHTTKIDKEHINVKLYSIKNNENIKLYTAKIDKERINEISSKTLKLVTDILNIDNGLMLCGIYSNKIVFNISNKCRLSNIELSSIINECIDKAEFTEYLDEINIVSNCGRLFEDEKVLYHKEVK